MRGIYVDTGRLTQALRPRNARAGCMARRPRILHQSPWKPRGWEEFGALVRDHKEQARPRILISRVLEQQA